MEISIIVRTYNEARYLPDVLEGIRSQADQGVSREVIVVDSGSTDGTKDIAKTSTAESSALQRRLSPWGLVEYRLSRGFGFGSGDDQRPLHSGRWLTRLVEPLTEGRVAIAYGCQRGNGSTRFSECRIFEKHFPSHNLIPQEGFFCNNANSAVLRGVWEGCQFDPTRSEDGRTG